MQKSFEIEQGVPEIWGFKRFEIILLRETKKEEKIPLCPPAEPTLFGHTPAVSTNYIQHSCNQLYISPKLISSTDFNMTHQIRHLSFGQQLEESPQSPRLRGRFRRGGCHDYILST